MSALKWLWGYIKKYWALLVGSIVMTVIYVACFLIHPVILGRFVDNVIKDNNLSLLFPYAMILITVILIKEVIVYIKQIMFELISQNTIKKIRNNLFAKLQRLDSDFYDRTSTGDLMARLTMDTEAIRQVIAGTVPTILNQICFIIFGFIIIFRISPVLTLALYVLAPIIGYAGIKRSKIIKQCFFRIREAGSSLNSNVQENINGNRVVKAYAREDYEISKFEKKNKAYYDENMHFVFDWIKFGPQVDFLVSMITVVFIGFGGFLTLNGTITIGEFTTVNGVLWAIVSPMQMIAGIINQFQQFEASSFKIIKLEQETPSIKNENVLKRGTGLTGDVLFRNVSFAFNGDRVLKGINFSAKPGDTVAIIGPTGSGKSTIVNLVSRFYDVTQGTIYLDGVNIKNIDITTIRKNIAYAMQDIFLFSDTIKNNISYGVVDATLEDVIRVAKEADADDFIRKMPDGYDTVVGEMGVGLSGGQRQRISLARALLKNPAILILDDTTSAVDMETEFDIQEALKNSYNNKTTFIIAHRISSVKNADLILVLNQGNIIEWGTHKELLAANGYYKGVYENQFGDFNKASGYHINMPNSFVNTKFGGEHNGSK